MSNPDGIPISKEIKAFARKCICQLMKEMQDQQINNTELFKRAQWQINNNIDRHIYMSGQFKTDYMVALDFLNTFS